MKNLLLILFLSLAMVGYTQSALNVTAGQFAQILDSAAHTDKPILLITGNNNCHYYLDFAEHVLPDSAFQSYINKEFIPVLFCIDKADKDSKKRMKKYCNSWAAYFEFHVLDADENLIARFSYPKYVSNEQFLEIIKRYKTLEDEWKTLRKIPVKDFTNLDALKQYILHRSLNYSSFDYLQINRRISYYINNLSNEDVCKPESWFLFTRYISFQNIGLDKDLIDLVARHKDDFQRFNGEKEVSDYLLSLYISQTTYLKPKKVKKLEHTFPYNTIPEAKKAIEIYWTKMNTQHMINWSSL